MNNRVTLALLIVSVGSLCLLAGLFLNLPEEEPTSGFSSPSAVEEPSVTLKQITAATALYDARGDVIVMLYPDEIVIPRSHPSASWWQEMWPPFEASPGRTDLRLTLEDKYYGD